MKIAILLSVPDFAMMLKKTTDALMTRHNIRVFCADSKYLEFDPVYFNSNWNRFDFSDVDKFKPDVVLCWNTVRPDTFSACEFLRTKYRVFCIENGWFPQEGNFYILPQNTAGGPQRLNSISEEPLKTSQCYEKTPRPLGLPARYVLVPGQLPFDTSISFGRKMLYCMTDFYRFVAKNSGDIPVIYSRHPKSLEEHHPDPGLKLIPNVWNLPTLRLAEHADAVVSFNSTVALESLFYHTAVLMFGKNPLDDLLPDAARYFCEDGVAKFLKEKDTSLLYGMKIRKRIQELRAFQFKASEGPSDEQLRLLVGKDQVGPESLA
jgi:hypothetical protein